VIDDEIVLCETPYENSISIVFTTVSSPQKVFEMINYVSKLYSFKLDSYVEILTPKDTELAKNLKGVKIFDHEELIIFEKYI